jgi:hypothetical protein
MWLVRPKQRPRRRTNCSRHRAKHAFPAGVAFHYSILKSQAYCKDDAWLRHSTYLDHGLQLVSDRTPNFTTHDRAHVVFSDKDAWVTLLVTLPQTVDGTLLLGISCSQSDWQLSSLTQACSSFFPQALISGVEDLYPCGQFFATLAR